VSNSDTVQSGGLSFAEGFEELLPKIASGLGRLVGASVSDTSLACGRHGCVLFTDDGYHVVKITGDRSEALGWLYVQEKQSRGEEEFLAGAVHVSGVWKVEVDFPGMFGTTDHRSFGVALLERVVPGHRSHHRGGDRGALSRRVSSYIDRRTYEPTDRIDSTLTQVGLSLKDHRFRKLSGACKASPVQLAGLCRMAREAASDGVWFEDVELHNVGWRFTPRPASLVLFDFGRVEVPPSLRRRLRRRWRGIPSVSLR
jgi:hypothetical protein